MFWLTIFAIPHSLFAQATELVVSSAELKRATVEASRARQENLQTLKAFFSTEEAQKVNYEPSSPVAELATIL